MNSTGEFLKSLRVSKGLTQIELAEYLNVSNKTISKWENDLGMPEVSTLIILADYYEVTVDDILRGTKRISRDNLKETNLTKYVVNRISNQYVQYFIISVGIWILSNVSMIVLGQITTNSNLGMGIGLIVILIGLIIQSINVNYLRLQVKDISIQEKRSLLNFVFHTSYILLYLSLASIFFALLYAVGSNSVLTAEAILNRMGYAFGLMGVSAIFLYYIMRALRISFLKKLTLGRHVLNGIMVLILLIPILVISILGPYQLAIKIEHSSVGYSEYYKEDNIDRYYTLKYLQIKSSTGISNIDYTYNSEENTKTYTFEDGYELIMTQQTEAFLETLDYQVFDINETFGRGYWILLSEFEMEMSLYTMLVPPLISLYSIAVIIYYYIRKVRKPNESLKSI
ncbi:helix-turn-helix domain-containing protein [Acholeplasma vituli]|uniref:Helix-turn-helix domain-containing protein n=1 Tax=Paracholeplasma vituli TaxID=69473 RepID=A0ABT2PXM0_9MOLU|nr:helix-turn-helix transcriptional regulator [Paracholeplasma vituli]MCU0105590.1 helix-turn-helix domain-containing protein [Paracholeplasma vituli]